jgi:hypothetical protein
MNFIGVKNRKGDKIYYYYDLGRGKGQRPAMGIFTYVNPKTQIERNHNKETKELLEVKRGNPFLKNKQ